MRIKPFENSGGYTVFENSILDLIMPICKPNTWKVVCATLRKTTGWRKESDRISISQYHELTGISGRDTLIRAIQDALDNNFIVREPAGNSFYYSLNRDYEMDVNDEMVLEPDQSEDDNKKTVLKSYRNRYENHTEIGMKIIHTKQRNKETKVSPVYEDIEPAKRSKTGFYAIAEALAEVTGMSMAINEKALLKEARALQRDERVTPELIRIKYGPGGPWYSQDWRGRKGQRPGLYEIRSTLFSFEHVEPNVIKGGLKDRPVKENGGLK